MEKERLEYINKIDTQLDKASAGLKVLSDTKCRSIIIKDIIILIETNLGNTRKECISIPDVWGEDLFDLISHYYYTKTQELQKEFDKL